MQKKPLIGLTLAVALITLVIMGCSALTPAPEVKIISVSPVGLGGVDSADVTVTFANRNKVDAIITTQQNTYIGTSTLKSALMHYSLFVNANTDSTVLVISMGGLNTIRSSIGSPAVATMWLKFYGEDAYGYNKTFSDSVSVSF